MEPILSNQLFLKMEELKLPLTQLYVAQISTSTLIVLFILLLPAKWDAWSELLQPPVFNLQPDLAWMSMISSLLEDKLNLLIDFVHSWELLILQELK